LEDYTQWKATEFRQFLLYIGPVILQKELQAEIFNHFVCLHVAVRILCQKSTKDIEYAEKLLKYFVECFIIIYRPEHVSYNIHGLLHITDSVKHLGPLDTFSAFPFENFLKELKSMLRKSEKPLEQLSNRYAEINFCETTSAKANCRKICIKDLHDRGPLVPGCFSPQFSKIEFPDFIISTKSSNNCCFIENDVVCLENIATTTEGKNVVIGRKFMIVDELYNNPCNSVHLGIFKVTKLSNLQVWLVRKINHKFLQLPCKEKEYYAMIPLINTTDC